MSDSGALFPANRLVQDAVGDETLPTEGAALPVVGNPPVPTSTVSFSSKLIVSGFEAAEADATPAANAPTIMQIPINLIFSRMFCFLSVSIPEPPPVSFTART